MSTEKYRNFASERENLNSTQDVLEFRQRLNNYSEEYHSNIIQKNIASLSVLDYTAIKEVKYSPFVTAIVDAKNLTVESLEALCESNCIENISVNYKPIADSNAAWNDTLEVMDAYDIVSTGQYTGSGVRIGIYEAGGVCDTSHSNLSDKNITIRNTNSPISSHATAVTSIVALIAPSASFFVSQVSDVSEGLSWFIDNNCDVINCSFSYYSNTLNSDGTYSKGVRAYRYDIDAIYDYQILAHFMTVCTSSANVSTDETTGDYNPDSDIASPGFAYNVITVGGVNRKYIDSAYRWIHASDACYVSNTPTVKPNISAPSYMLIPNVGLRNGTSFSTPLVTACIAILEGCKPSYSAYPDRVMSVLTSTAQKTYDYGEGNFIGNFNKKVGAGIIDLDAAIESYQYTVLKNTNSTPRTEIISKELTLTAGTEIQIALSWLVTADATNETVYVTDYDLYLYNSTGTRVVTSSLTRTNVEMLRYIVPTTETYRIVAFQFSPMNSNVDQDWISLTYTVWGDDVGHVHCYEGECIPNDTSTHKRMCYCGEGFINEEHDWTAVGGNRMRCLECMLTYVGTIPGGTIQSIENPGVRDEIYGYIIKNDKYSN